MMSMSGGSRSAGSGGSELAERVLVSVEETGELRANGDTPRG